MAATLDPEEVKRLVESSSQIPMHTFQVALGVLFGLALCCFIARMAIRLTYHKRLGVDDALLILAVFCLCAGTSILYDVCYFTYMQASVVFAPQVIPYVNLDINELLEARKKRYLFMALTYTAIFAVKGCFIAYMRPFVWYISRAMNWYYWFIVVFCTISWAFVVAGLFITCPHFDGPDAVSCVRSTGTQKPLPLGISRTVLDVLTDIMIISIPVIILRGAHLSLSTKFGLGVFSCLSIFMAMCSIIRVSNWFYKGQGDDVKDYFWLEAEGAVAVIMASVNTFRTLFVKQRQRDPECPTPRSPVDNFCHRICTLFRPLARVKPDEKPPLERRTSSVFKLPQVPPPVFTSIRTYIRRQNGTDGGAEELPTTNSMLDDSEIDYHAALKASTRANR
ncbi:hypothetical protein F5B19DRAFT_486729 [Rostrohypoxylon terebratum]|nr:hypothetical protein F5B19DRAFT_486729 [Rostrohypoxylon terebratum]